MHTDRHAHPPTSVWSTRLVSLAISESLTRREASSWPHRCRERASSASTARTASSAAMYLEENSYSEARVWCEQGEGACMCGRGVGNKGSREARGKTIKRDDSGVDEEQTLRGTKAY